jgi:hypothetical protein
VQKHIATAVNAERRDVFARNLSDRDLARFTSQCTHPAQQWLNAIPSCPELSITDDLIKFSVHLALGTPLPLPIPPVCICKTVLAVADPAHLGRHFEVCKASQIIATHDKVCNLLFELAKAAGHSTSAQSSLHNIAIDGSMTRPDGIIRTRLGEGKEDTAFDVEIVHPSPPSRSAIVALSASHSAEVAKVEKHQKNCRRVHLSFRPFVLEYYGSFGPSAASLFSDLTGEIDPSDFVPPNWAARTPSQYWEQRFSLMVTREHAASVRHISEIALSASGIHLPPPRPRM